MGGRSLGLVVGFLVSQPARTRNAELQFSFWPIDPATEKIIKEVTAPIVNGIVIVEFTAKSTGDLQAKKGQIWIQICDQCSFAEEPEGSEGVHNDPIVRRKRFDSIAPGVYFDKTTLKIMPPAEGEYFTIAFKYSCEQCPPMDNKHPQKLRVNLVRPSMN
jgi:hypothetical protein